MYEVRHALFLSYEAISKSKFWLDFFIVKFIKAHFWALQHCLENPLKIHGECFKSILICFPLLVFSKLKSVFHCDDT